MKKTVVLLLLVLCIMPLWAQVEQPKHVEFDVASFENYFHTVSAGNKGLLLYREVKNRETKMERKIEVYFLDTDLNVVWHEYYYVHFRFYNIGNEYRDNYFYLLFQQNVNSLNADLFVLRIRLEDQRFETFLIERYFPMVLVEFKVIGNTLIFAGYSEEKPTVVCYTFGKPQPIVLPGFYNAKNWIFQLQIDTINNRFNVLTNFRFNDNRKSISMKSFDPECNMLQNVDLLPSEGNSLLDGRLVSTNEDFMLVAGTYTKKKSNITCGIFLSSIASNSEHTINYYSFSDLKNFFGYMKIKKRKRVEERNMRRKIKGREINLPTYGRIDFNAVKWGNQYIMVGEASSQPYNYDVYNVYNGYNNLNYISYPEKFNKIHAFVMGLDEKGHLLWDNSFEIKDVTTYEHEQHFHSAGSADSFGILYYDNEIRSKVVYGNDVIEGKLYDDLVLSFTDTHTAINSDIKFGGLENWYENTLYAYGVKKIWNMEVPGMISGKDVFFIYKILYK